MTDYSHSSRFIPYIVHIFHHIFFSVTISLFISRSGQLKCLSDLGGTETLVSLLPKVDHRNTCGLGHCRLTKIHCSPRRYRNTCSKRKPKGVCRKNLHVILRSERARAQIVQLLVQLLSKYCVNCPSACSLLKYLTLTESVFSLS